MAVSLGKDENLKQMYATGKFDPAVYVKTFYSGSLGLEDEERFFLDAYHYIFEKKLVYGDNVLDLGTGPTMQTMISASGHAKKITLSDFVRGSRDELSKWLNDDPRALDFKFIYEYVGQLEKREVAELERRVRSKVTNIVHCDVTSSNPLAPLVNRYDIVVSNLCLESAVSTRENYVQALKNVSTLVKPSGFFLLSGSFGCEEYHLGEHTFALVNLSHEFMEEALELAGFKIHFWMILPRDEDSSIKHEAVFSHCYALVAQKV